MRGKEKCRILKQIRTEIARNNDIAWVTSECKHQGECKGTCPKCEAEVRQLERAIESRRRLGKNVAVAGVAAGMVLSATACAAPDPAEFVTNVFHNSYNNHNQPLGGAVQLTGDVDDTIITETELLTGEVVDGTETEPPCELEVLEGDVPMERGTETDTECTVGTECEIEDLQDIDVPLLEGEIPLYEE